jgi:anhydro-N-acetylmuramic acid kinase
VAIRRSKSDDAGLYLGLNSGTSADRIDACLVRLPGGERHPLRVRVVSRAAAAIPRDLRGLLLSAPDGLTVRDLCTLDARLGELFGLAARRAIEAAGLTSGSVRAAGLHGQTVCHLPSPKGRSATLQIGSPEQVALVANVPVVSGFRQADTAAGGEGAPLSPILDLTLFGETGSLVLNLGGIANLTMIPRGGDPKSVLGLDVGPGNMLLDGLVRFGSGGKKTRDTGGSLACRGWISLPLLEHALAYPPLALRRTRSIGREEFGAPYLRYFLDGARGLRLAFEDLLATAATVTAECASRSLPRAAAKGIFGDSLWVCGGGIHNRAVVEELQWRFAARGYRVRPFMRGGVSASDRECVLFAFLAREFVAGRAANLPSVTGARRPVVLGRWTPRPAAGFDR